MTVTPTSFAVPPRVTLEISDAPDGAERLSVLRAAQGFTQPVIQARGALVGGEALVTDWAAAVGREMSYTVSAIDASGSVLEQVSVTVPALPDTPPSWVWISDPLDETSPMLVYAVGDTGRQTTRPATIALTYPISADYPTAHVGQRRGISRFLLTIKAVGQQEQAAVNALLDAPAVCVRIGTTGLVTAMVPPVLYGVAAEPDIQAGAGREDVAYVTLDLAPTSGPGISAINSAWSWDDLTATGLTWDEVASVFASWWDVAKGES